MGITKRKIETFTVAFKTTEEFNLSELLTCSEVVGREVKVKGKYVSLKVLDSNSKTIVGLVETSRNENIPPKKNLKTKTIAKLGLDEGDGLAYGNIFIYEIKRNILMYEVNKFGCYIDHFLEYLYRCCKGSEQFKNFDLRIDPLMKAHEYQRMLKMNFHKSIELELAHPEGIIRQFETLRHRNDAILNVCRSGESLGSTKVRAKFEVSARKSKSGLLSRPIKEIVDSALELARSNSGASVEKLIIYGYERDSDDETLHPIDLLGDRYIRYIELDEPRENSDLLEWQRKSEIRRIYNDSLEDFDYIFGK